MRMEKNKRKSKSNKNNQKEKLFNKKSCKETSKEASKI